MGNTSPNQSGTPTPLARDVFKDTPALRPSSRHLQKAILGENTPPSATMQALQSMTIPREYLEPLPLSNINNNTARTPRTNSPPANSPRANSPPANSPPAFDAISNQLVSITTIVSSLQKDMQQLSRRSKDNATDLVSLKEATSSRDEDIRKSLKDLIVTMHQDKHAFETPGNFSRSGSSFGLKDPHMTPTKQFSLPRLPSPSSMFIDERIGSPNPYSVEGAASVAMLEKIIREMVTKDGQERLVANLQSLVDKATGDTAKKVAELVEFVKQGSVPHPLGTNAAPESGSFQPSPGSGALTRTMQDNFPLQMVSDGTKPYSSPKAADFVSDEMLKFLRKIKDSVAEAGCVTMGTKTLIQELRGEVLGMGRELARKIEEVEQTQAEPRSLDSGEPSQEIGLIVQEGLTNLKEHMERVMRDRRRQSISSVATRNTVDSNEVHDVVKQVMAKRGDDMSAQGEPLDKEAIICAVREAYEAYQPDVKIEQFGLEREEVLQCLREGLQDYRSSGGVTREDIEDIIHDSIQNLKLPAPINEAHEMREEVLMAVRECLEDFKPISQSNQSSFDGLAKEFIVEAIREGLANQAPQAQELELDPDILFEAVSRGLQAWRPQLEPQGGEVMNRLQVLVDGMHEEFKSYSSANGRDTEQVLDAVRDGLDKLRTDIESYVNKAQDVTQKDEIAETFHVELERLREDIQGYVAEGPRGDQAWSRGDMVGYIKSEFENLHETLSSQFLPASSDKEELLNALNAGFEGMKSQVVTRGFDPESDEEINEAMKHELDHLKEVILGDNVTQKNELLDRLQDGFDLINTRLGDDNALTHSNADVVAAMKEEFEHLRETLGGSLVRSGASDKDDIIDAVRELIDGLRSQLETSRDHTANGNMSTIQSELESLKEHLGNTLVRAGGSVEQEEILNTLRSGLEDMKANSKSMGINEELLEAFRGELEQVRQSNGLVRQHGRADTEVVLEAVRLGLDDLRSHMEKRLDNPEAQMSSTNEIINALNDGLEGLRTDVTKVVEKPVDMTISHEILDTLKQGLASLREDIDKLKGKKDDSDTEEEHVLTGNEIVLAEDRGLVADRELVEDCELAEVEAFVEESEQVTSREMVTESPAHNDFEKVEIMLSQLHLKIEAMDVNLQSQPSTHEPTAAPPGSVMKEDLVSIEELLKDLQATVLLLQDREQQAPSHEGLATKEDTDAIETLLANLKAKVDEIIFPDPTTSVTKENLDDVELVVRTTSEAIEGLAKKIEEDGATKGDVAVIQVIVDDIKVALDEMKATKLKKEEEAIEKATKPDIDALSLLVCDIKVKIDELKIPDGDDLPSKADLEQLTGLIHDFRDSHDAMRDSYEGDIHTTANMFNDRRAEAENIMVNMMDVKAALDDIKEEIKTNLSEGGAFEGLKESFKSLEDTIGADFSTAADVKELMETVSREFERAHGSIEGLQNDQAEKSALTLEKHDEVKDAIIAGLVEKVDDRFNTLMAKYDDAQLLADEQARTMKEKAEEQEKILETTKIMADELRLSIDTLGSTIASMNDRFEESTQKWTTESTAVFGKLDDSMTKLEEQKDADKTEHSHTRDEIANVERIFNGLQDNITEYHPKFMVTLREIETLVKLHYEHSQKVKETAEEQVRTMNEEARTRSLEIMTHFANLPKLLPAPPPVVEAPPMYDDAQVQEKLDKLLGHSDAQVQEKLDKLLCHSDPQVQEKLDKLLGHSDPQVQEKLDKLLGHSDATEKSFTQLNCLDEIHRQVQATAAEVTEFVAKQTQLITDGNEAKEREAEEIALIVERRIAQKEQLESDIESLRADKERVMQEIKEEKELVMQELSNEKARVKEEREHAMQELSDEKARAKEEREHAMQELGDEKARIKEEREHAMQELREEKDRAMLEMKEEKDSLLAVVASLQAERENLANQKVRLTGQVSSLHTALDIRREELQMMDAKADALERRILNGIMDHSRALMMSKAGPKSPTKLKKRMSADVSGDTSKMMPPPSTAANGLSLALKPRPAIRRNGPPQNPANRRVFSLNPVSGNASPVVQPYAAPGNNVAAVGGLKRSHSVKTNYLRKGSWNGRPSVVADKENETLKEEEGETESEHPRGQLAIEDNHSISEANYDDDLQSETGTERRHSIGTGSYYEEDETPGYAGSDYTYGSGSSYMTGSDIDRRTSYGSTARSALQGAETIDEGSEADDSHSEDGAEDDELTATIDPAAVPSEITASDISNATTDDIPMPTDSEFNEAIEQVQEDMKNGMRLYSPPSDSGVGTDLATAHFENESEADYFRRAAEEEESTVD
jgi:DNA repair exonuclease SbcCD ATPase subunit